MSGIGSVASVQLSEQKPPARGMQVVWRCREMQESPISEASLASLPVYDCAAMHPRPQRSPYRHQPLQR